MNEFDSFEKKSFFKPVIKPVFFILTILLFAFHSFSQNNYQLTAVNATFTAISGGTAVPEIQTYSTLSNPIDIGYTFTYNGVNYSQVVVSSQGYLSFNTSAGASYSVDLINTANRPLVAPLWGNSVNGNGGSAKYITTGTAPNRVFTFEWLNWQWGGSNSMSFQVKLYETTNQIEFIYSQEAGALNYPSAAIGMAFQNTGIGNFVSLSDAGTSPTISTTIQNTSINTKPATGQIYRFNYSIDPEPDGQVTNFGAGNSIVNILLNWTDAAGTQLPDGYLIMASATNSFSNPVDGVDIVPDYDLSDGVGIVKVAYGIESFSSWTNFPAMTNYYYRIYSYTNNGIYINYNTDAPIPSVDFFTPVFLKQYIIDGSYGAASWGDFDKDGFLDIIIANKIYRNNGDNTFAINTAINDYPGFYMIDIYPTWGDYDNDEDLDVLFTYGFEDSWNHNKYLSNIFRNDNGILNLSESNLMGFYGVSVSWADIYNDGHLDCVLAGNLESNKLNEYVIPTTKVYFSENDTNYVESSISLIGGQNVSIVDYNNDNYQDILVMGTDINTIRHTTLYKNNGNNTFTQQKNIHFTGLSDCSAAWGDYNNDGNLDLLLAGKDINGLAVSKLYQNNGDNTFTEQSGISLFGASNASVNWGDYNNDGYADILIGGLSNNYFYSSKIYKNNGDNTFTEQADIANYAQKGSMAWSDYDNDGDLDFVSQGNVWKNYTTVNNTKPSIPQNLKQTRINQQTIKFSWDESADAETPSKGLSYNIRVGTQPGKSDVVFPYADASNGNRRLVGMGNANLCKEFIITNLLPGQTYYWSVQTIDNGFLASDFSPEQSFTVIPDFSMGVNLYINGANPAAWADFDNDNSLDLIIGFDMFKNYGSDTFSKLYPVSGTVDNQISCADYNNDGLVDYIESNVIFKNDGSDYIQQTDITLKSLSDGNSIWGDYDNDGDADILITGKENPESEPVSIIYRNDGNNIFTEQVDIVLKGGPTAAWGDYDNDGDIDILIGNIIYKNNGNNTFNEQTGISLIGKRSDSWGDYDSDGDLDILVTGIDSISNPITNIYRNDGNNNFTIIETEVRKVNGHAAWGDYNNDGYMDIVLSGKSGYDILHVYTNNGDDTFYENFNNDGTTYQTQVGWGDYNNDGNLDFFESGMAYERPNDIPSFKIFKNNMATVNHLPGLATNLKHEIVGFDIKLSWTKAIDENCPTGSLYYNIRVGTSPGGIDIISPMSDLTNGFRKIPAIGNAQCNTFSILKNLDPGKNYYWSVQAIDQSFAGGAWALEQSFNLPNISANFSADTLCFGSAMSFADNSLSPEEPVTSWLWDFGDGGGTSTLQNPNYIYGAPGEYNVTLTVNSASYQHSITKTVVVKPSVKATFTAPNVCMGKPMIINNTSQTNGLNITSWNWSFGDQTPDFNGQNPPPHNYLADSAYTIVLKVTVDNGCADSAANEVIIGKVPSAIISTNGNTTFCAGNKFIMTAESYPNFKYEWRKSNVPLLDKTSNLLEVTESGTYKAIITNLLGNCSVTSTDYAVTVNPVPSKPILTFAENPAVYCQGNVLDISATNIAGINYQWLKNNSPISGATGNSIQANETGLYRLLVSNNYGCSDTSSTKVDLTIHPKPNVSSTLSVSGLTTFCAGNSVQLEAEYNPDYIYKWKKDGMYIVASENIFSPNQTGSYSAEVSTANNCTINTNPVTITVHPIPEIPDINNASSLTICDGDNIDLITDEVAGLSYQWYLNGGALADGKNPVYIASQEGIYTLSAINSNNCSVLSTKSVDLKVVKLPSNTNIQLNGLPTICPGQPIELSIENIPGLTYQWKKEGDAIIGAINASFVANSSGNYSVEITNNQCSVTSPLQPITEKAGPPIPEMYLRGNVVWYIACTATEGANYTWYKNGDSIPNSNHNIIVPNPAEGTYYVELSDGSECPSRSVDVKIPDDFKTGKFKTLIDIDGLKDSKTSAVIYPNPNHGKFNLMLDNEYKGKLYIKIKDLSGRTMRQYYADKNENFFIEEMDLSTYGAGVYFVEFDFDYKKIIKKAIVK